MIHAKEQVVSANEFAFSKEWDKHFFEMAELVSSRSKDPSTKCGAVIVRPDKTVCSTGFNGFAKRMSDFPYYYNKREEKLSRIIHCEMNALIHAKEPVEGYTLFVHPFCTCDRCAVHMVQAGIDCVAIPVSLENSPERWQESIRKALFYYEEAGVRVVCAS